MQISDKSLTIATSICLAISVAVVGFVFREGKEPVESNSSLPTSSFTQMALVDSSAKTTGSYYLDIAPVNVPAKTSKPVRMLVFASLEPSPGSDRSPNRLGTIDFRAMTDAPQINLISESKQTEGIVAIPSAAKSITAARSIANLPQNSRTDLSSFDWRAQKSDNCSVELTTLSMTNARMKLAVAAPCHPNSEATFSYSGLQFRQRLGDSGRLELTLPAFSEFSEIDLILVDGTHASIGAYVAGLQSIERVGISWRGKDDTFLHAYEGSGTREKHRWRFSPGSVSRSHMDGGGYMTLLGDPNLDNPQLAQVYSHPSGRVPSANYVKLDVETLRGESDCGGELILRTAHYSPKAGYSRNTNRIHLTACGGENDSLVLNNIVKDLRMALN